MATVRERLDQTLERIRGLDAEPTSIVLTDWDRKELMGASGAGASYAGIPARPGQIGGQSYVEARKPDGQVVEFGF
jgi:hypothetical protein